MAQQKSKFFCRVERGTRKAEIAPKSGRGQGRLWEDCRSAWWGGHPLSNSTLPSPQARLFFWRLQTIELKDKIVLKFWKCQRSSVSRPRKREGVGRVGGQPELSGN